MDDTAQTVPGNEKASKIELQRMGGFLRKLDRIESENSENEEENSLTAEVVDEETSLNAKNLDKYDTWQFLLFDRHT